MSELFVNRPIICTVPTYSLKLDAYMSYFPLRNAKWSPFMHK